MKYFFAFLIIIIGTILGVFIGLGIFEGFEVIIALFLIFPAAIITILLLFKRKSEKTISIEDKKQDRFSKWE